MAVGQLALGGGLDLRRLVVFLRFRHSLVASLPRPRAVAQRFRMPGTGGESRADVAILIGIKVCFLALIVLPALDVASVDPVSRCWCEVRRLLGPRG